MTGTFAAAARSLAGQSALLLGWRPHDFWTATPAELAAVFDALAEATPAAVDRAALTRLMESHPDAR